MPNTKKNRTRNQRGSGIFGAPLSYIDPSYKEPSGPAGSTVNVSEVGLARPSLNMTGGARRRYRRRHLATRSKKVMHGGFFPGVMGSFVQNAKLLVPTAGITAYRMYKNFNKTKKNRY